MKIAHVVFPIPLTTIFDYIIPGSVDAALSPGMRVQVEFGSHKFAIGIVVAADNNIQNADIELKTIQKILDKVTLFPPNLWKLLTWSASYYHHPLGEVLFHALPVLLRQGKAARIKSERHWQLTAPGRSYDPNNLKNSPKQQALLRCLQADQNQKTSCFDRACYQNLADRGLVKEVTLDTLWPISRTAVPSPIVLNQEQLKAIQTIQQYIGQFQVCLLEGVTGSGKTEVYLTVIDTILKQNLQALVLIPEISLTPQTLQRFKERYAVPIAMLHSGMTEKERLDVFLRSEMGQLSVIIGTRSALFTPFKHLGCIVVDEEHDPSYKQQEGFRYHARDMAVVRARFEQVPVILGSATPSLESLYHAQSGKYHHLKLTRRAGNATFASQHIIDLRGLVLTAGISKPLLMRMQEHLNKDQQVLLFLNRRGYAPILLCHTCAWIATCPRCNKAYTYHQKQNKLSCHHCEGQKTVPGHCPKCQSMHLHTTGVGTEQIEAKLTSLFPNIPVTRFDRDAITKKGALESQLALLQKPKAHILVGTQILAKGHHFPHVTLVGILDVDSALFSSDFRATERLAQVYTQVAGRAGREQKSGEVILQTYHPRHPLLSLLLNQNYHAFATKALYERKVTFLPPFTYHVLIRAADKNNQFANRFLQRLYEWIKQHYQDPKLCLLSPCPAILAKKSGFFRWQLLLQHSNRSTLHQLINAIQNVIDQWPERKRLRLAIEIDPLES